MGLHACPITDCPELVDDRFVMCRVHWSQVPHGLQTAVYRTWKSYQATGRGLVAYRAARQAAIAAVRGGLTHGRTD